MNLGSKMEVVSFTDRGSLIKSWENRALSQPRQGLNLIVWEYPLILSNLSIDRSIDRLDKMGGTRKSPCN